MSARGRFTRMRRPLAAVLAVGGVVLGSVAALGGSSASAADGDLVATTTYSCTIVGTTFPATVWQGEATLTALRPAGSTTVEIRAVVSDMTDNGSPVGLSEEPITNKLKLNIGGQPVELTGAGIVDVPPRADIAMPELRGSFSSSEATVDVSVVEFSFSFPDQYMDGLCTPTANAAIGTLTLGEGTLPPPPPTPTTTTKPTATPTPSASTPPKGKSGKPAKGETSFACTMNIGSTFDYDATVSVSGYRAEEGDDISLSATMTDLPGISPVPINGTMDYSLGLKVGGEEVTLTSQAEVNAPANQEVAVANLSGTVAVDGDEHEVEALSFGFDFPSAGINVECEGGAVLGKMTVGSEPLDEDPSPSASTSTAPVSAGDTLPKTGGGDSLPVIALWALALTLLGAAGLLCVPQARRQH